VRRMNGTIEATAGGQGGLDITICLPKVEE